MKSIYKSAAEYGLLLGVALSVMFLCAAYSLRVPLLSVVSAAIFLGVPVLIWKWLRTTYRESGLKLAFSALWMEGICIFLFGCLVMSVVMYVFMRYVEPDFIVRELMAASEVYASAGGSMTEVSELIDKMIESGNLPTPIAIAVEFIWLGVFTGSLLSMLVSFIVKKTTRR